MIDMNDTKNELARTESLAFSHALAPSYSTQLGERLIGAYLIGSLAHGGFSHRYSDIDVALVTEDALDAATLTTLRALAAEQDAALSQKLSVFWADRHFVMGRMPPLDRANYLDHAVAISERERVRPARPTRKEIRLYLKGEPFSNWIESAKRFAKDDVLAPGDHKAFIRALLYPARLVYSWTHRQRHRRRGRSGQPRRALRSRACDHDRLVGRLARALSVARRAADALIGYGGVLRPGNKSRAGFDLIAQHGPCRK